MLMENKISKEKEEEMKKIRGFEIAKGFEDKGINLPERKTKFSAGYDIEAAEDVIIPSFKKGMKPTIIKTGLNIQLYINSNTKLDYSSAIIVNDVDEAIAQINYNGSRYSSAIFTNSSENASKFIKEVKSKIVTINTSPTIERIIDIKQTDLINEKTIIYPTNFKFDGNNSKININKYDDLK